MNQKRKLTARFEAETEFDTAPIAPTPYRTTRENELERLKQRLLQAALEQTEPAFSAPLRQAANEAVALVWLQAFPLLLLPELFAEMARAATARFRRQQRVFDRSRALYGEAV